MKYIAYNLVIDSDLALPELPATGNLAVSDLETLSIRQGIVPKQLETVTGEGVFYQLNPSQYRLDVPKVARYYIEQGQVIIVEPYPESNASSVRLFLLETVLAVWFYQRGEFPLRASAINTPHGAVLFIGSSGIGKSTLAAAFVHRGYPLLSDNIAIIAFNNQGRATVAPGFAMHFLWADALLQLNLHLTETVTALRPTLKKYRVPACGSFCQQNQPIHRMFILSEDSVDQPMLKPVIGKNKFIPLTSNTYLPQVIKAMQRQKEQIQMTIALSQQGKIHQVIRPAFHYSLKELIALVDENISQ